jgi:hypothetical protein
MTIESKAVYYCQRNTAACLDCYSTSIVAYVRKPRICNNTLSYEVLSFPVTSSVLACHIQTDPSQDNYMRLYVNYMNVCLPGLGPKNTFVLHKDNTLHCISIKCMRETKTCKYDHFTNNLLQRG